MIFCGDLNVAHTELDLANPKPNRGKKGFTDEERKGFQNMLDTGFVDRPGEVRLGGVGPAEQYVLADGSVQYGCVLLHVTALGAQGVQRHPLDVDLVQQNPSRVRAVEALQQRKQCRLPGAGCAHQCGERPRRHLQRQIAEHGPALWVREADALEANLGGVTLGTRRSPLARRRFEPPSRDVIDAARGAQALLQ